jgi:hypothetical protein
MPAENVQFPEGIVCKKSQSADRPVGPLLAILKIFCGKQVLHVIHILYELVSGNILNIIINKRIPE